jgi:hypothetical protein
VSKLRRASDGKLLFHCPGCECSHGVSVDGQGRPVWGWNGSAEAPTFTPSILIRSGHYDPHRQGDQCWCTYNAAHPDNPAPFVCGICHSVVRDGRIQFLADSTHNLAGQTVEIPEWDDV